ncbi:MAG TPA: cytochrome c [Vicinamibacterales bacterium]
MRTACAVWTMTLLGSMLSAQQTAGPGRRSVWDRVYTEAQASRGAALYARHCEQCHGTGLDGDTASEIPGLAFEGFIQRWRGRTADDLLLRMERSMPPTAPGSLTRAQYADLVAYVFKSNGFPQGFEALGVDLDRLRQIVIDRAP